MKNSLQQVSEQIGVDAVIKSVGVGLEIHNCTAHGMYACPMGQAPKCPLCPSIDNVENPANGTSATVVEHYINFGQELGTNPQQKLNPFGL